MDTLVSVIIPAYGAESTIARAVESVLAQTYKNWEIIVISDDGTDYGELLKTLGITHSRMRFISTGGVGKGASYARNAGLDTASANVIALLDADDIFYPEKLERMTPLALRHGVCCCALHHTRYDDNGRHVLRTTGAAASDMLLTPDRYLEVHYSANSMLVFDRTQFPSRWLENLPVMEDLVFSMSAFEYLPAVYHLNEVLHEYAQSENSLCTSAESPARFIYAKECILEMLDAKTLGIIQPDAVQAFRSFVQVSLETEKEYAKALERNPSVTFTELLEQRLFPAQ